MFARAHAKRSGSFACLLLLFTLGALPELLGEEQSNSLHFPASGFSMQPLESPQTNAAQQILLMALPAKEGFAPNVNVQLQPYTKGLDDYIALSLEQFREAKLTVLGRKKVGNATALFEYSGDLQGHKLHWYARAEYAPGRVYLITATALESQWASVSDKLKACVDSFRLDPKPGVSAVRP